MGTPFSQLSPKIQGMILEQGITPRHKPIGIARAEEMGKPKIHEVKTRSKLRGPKSEYHEAAALDGATEAKAISLQRIIVRFTGYRVRPLDPDNFAGGCKDLLDGLRHAGLILGDEPWRIRFETEQVRVNSFIEEKTVIEIG